jgi:hypothetical protein
MSDHQYEMAEIGRLYQSNANTFALKIEACDNGATEATRWLNINRDVLDALLSEFASRETCEGGC